MHVFVIAMPKEANAVKHNLSLAFTRTIHGMEVTKGLIKNKEETAVVVSGIGKTNAAAATMLAINLFNPKSIINIGLAGGLDPELQMGYIVKVKKAVQSDFSLNGIDGVPVGVMDGNAALVALDSDGDRLGCALEICLTPDTEGDESGIQLGGVLHFVVNA